MNACAQPLAYKYSLARITMHMISHYIIMVQSAPVRFVWDGIQSPRKKRIDGGGAAHAHSIFVGRCCQGFEGLWVSTSIVWLRGERSLHHAGHRDLVTNELLEPEAPAKRLRYAMDMKAGNDLFELLFTEFCVGSESAIKARFQAPPKN